jgi:hypothetical protein
MIASLPRIHAMGMGRAAAKSLKRLVATQTSQPLTEEQPLLRSKESLVASHGILGY